MLLALLFHGVSDQKITAEYVALAQRLGPIYNRFCHLGFSHFFIAANPCFGPDRTAEIVGPAVLPSDAWSIPQLPAEPCVIDGDKLFENSILPLTVLTEIAPSSGGSLMCVPVFFSIDGLLKERSLFSHPTGIMPRSIIRLSIQTLARVFTFNNDRDAGILYTDPVDNVPVQISNTLLQFIAAGSEADPVCRLKFTRMATHAGSQNKGLVIRRRPPGSGINERAMVFDPVYGKPMMSHAVSYRTTLVPSDVLLRFPKDYSMLMGGQLPA